MLFLSSRTGIAYLLAGFVAAGFLGCSMVKPPVEPYQAGGQAPPAGTAQQPPAATPVDATSQAHGRPAGPGAGDRHPGTGQAISPKALLPVLTQVDDRVAAYEEKIRGGEGVGAEAEKLAGVPGLQEKVAGCQERIKGILSRYNSLHDQLIRLEPGQSPAAATMDELQAVTREDIGYLEGECQQLLAGGQPGQAMLAGNAAAALAQGEKTIAEAMAAGDYPQVIALYEQLPVAEGVKPSYASVFSYGQALLRTGREKDAAHVLTTLLQDVQQQDQLGKEFQLRQLVADIRFALEDYNSAFDEYVAIINRYAGLGENIEWARKQQTVINARNQQGPEVQAFAQLMRAYLGYNQPRDGFKVVMLAEQFLARFPESTVAPTVNRLLFETRDSAQSWYDNIVQQVTQLKEAKKYAEAQQLLQGLPLQDLPADKQAQLHTLNNEMTSIQTQEVEAQRAAQETALEDSWGKGQNYLQLKEYDQAIGVFTGLLNTAYADRAQAQIKEAANLASQENRQKAAELFVQAGTAKDQTAKVGLLMQSRQLLQDILHKYPQADLVEKARKNLERIEQEIRAIDPALLTAPPPDNAPAAGAVPEATGQGVPAVNVGELQVQPAPVSQESAQPGGQP